MRRDQREPIEEERIKQIDKIRTILMTAPGITKILLVAGVAILAYGLVFTGGAAIESVSEPQEKIISQIDRTRELELSSPWLKTGIGDNLTQIKLFFLFTTEDVFAVENRIDVKAQAFLVGSIEAEKIVLFLDSVNINYTAINEENYDDVYKSAKENQSVLELFEVGRSPEGMIKYFVEGNIKYPIEHQVSIFPVFIGKNGEFGPFSVVEKVLTINPAYTKLQAEASIASLVESKIQDRTNRIIIGLTLVIISGIPFAIGTEFYLKDKKQSRSSEHAEIEKNDDKTDSKESKRRFDENIITGFLAGGFGIMLYEVLKTLYGHWFVKSLTNDEINKEIHPMIFAGFLVGLFALVYALIVWWSRRKQAKEGT